MTEAEKLLLESNDVLRSAYQIAERAGVETNWAAWQLKLIGVLVRQHSLTNHLRETVGRPDQKLISE